MFECFAQERQIALDENLHDRLLEQGSAAADQQNIDSLREIVVMIVRNGMPNETENNGVATHADPMR